jgi:hypothetical protein
VQSCNLICLCRQIVLCKGHISDPVMNSLFLTLLVALLASAAAFQLGRPAGSMQMQRLGLRMSTEGEVPAPKEWVGAKKFSMKDRYTETVFSNVDIAKILPHRYPFLLVDRVVEFEAGKRAVGIKCISANEPQFTGTSKV